MRHIFAKTTILLFIQGAAIAHATDVNIGISVVEPGMYGRVNIGNAPPPAVVYAQPIIIERQTRFVEPIYLNVPPGHSKHWEKHCHEYHACGRPVYFVKTAEYEPGWHGKKHDADDDGRRHGHGKGRGHDD